MNELNELTKRLYAEGYSREEHSPDACWSDYQNLGYRFEVLFGWAWETPCGLLIQGSSNIGRGLAFEDTTYGRGALIFQKASPALSARATGRQGDTIISRA